MKNQITGQCHICNKDIRLFDRDEGELKVVDDKEQIIQICEICLKKRED